MEVHNFPAKQERLVQTNDVVCSILPQSQDPPAAEVSNHTKRLPPELLSETFKSYHHLYHTSGSKATANLLTLGHICSRWRNVALCLTPTIWTQLSLTSAQCANDQHRVLLEEWISRASPLTISLTIKYSEASDERRSIKASDSHTLDTPLTTMALSGSAPPINHDWEAIDIPSHRFLLPSNLRGVSRLSMTLPLRSLQDLAVDRHREMPDLKVLHLAARDEGDKAPFVLPVGSPLIDWSGCPILEHVTIENITPQFNGRIPGFIEAGLVASIPWAQITHLTLHGLSQDLSLVSKILVKATKLVVCDLKLEISAHWHDPQSLPALLDLRCRPQFSLTSLTLHSILVAPIDQLLEFLASPTLQTLELAQCCVLQREIILALTIVPGIHDILPRLKHLSIMDTRVDVHLDDDTVLDMIESRMAQLERVKIWAGPLQRYRRVRLVRTRAGSATFERAKALEATGLVLDYPRLTEAYWQ
ncbi:hypothetical protein Hypma_010651 [Hypsizygus marmoreus]|uniref:Uncharacterized protein n=1 Tax=Hypsizygus marmoreus TaxID=39966 RepID=A0A369JIX3_HYPMA|nr:hypothetical protein Hypma_010651 [Hypsizygus marmoreus]